MAEQVVGPYSKPYHKPCLTCVVCNKRLDSTLLLEHDGEPYCKSCHKTHLGQGKGGFGLSVPLRPEKPIALQASPKPSNGYKSEAARRVEERLAEEMSGINLSARRDNPSPTMREPTSPSTYQPRTQITTLSKPTTVAQIGTPLCARCQRPVYFAEQKQAASRKWHRACLRCDGCSTTLESGKLEEGPLSATYEFPTNVWCRTCYAKRFGPKGIGNAGMSLPENAR
ncbi:uncharacterized protein FA14DRAFT_123411 [Meira miltonrushii]|uniref:LIM zinc-binding domain-containing protein n=1 Tax=Meira miltonrushii TaxID=1280837 RepID=A0A316VEU6_9BASI|nr:uncharacterized protein FA14DRAFT_123411 [Meira miltonrushii]PWN34005.1 hypothetical protein FA14DRAFT_123411 [Meira miltonrushii]